MDRKGFILLGGGKCRSRFYFKWRHPMTRTVPIAAVLFAITLPSALSAQTGVSSAPVREVIDTYFGTRVADPYRWMETTNSPELLSYLNRQGELTRSALSAFSNQRRSMLGRILALQ